MINIIFVVYLLIVEGYVFKKLDKVKSKSLWKWIIYFICYSFIMPINVVVAIGCALFEFVNKFYKNPIDWD